MTDYDITIIGAGPAGATLARMLAGKFRVLVIDRGRAKCCGGLIHPDVQRLISRYGLVMPNSVLEGPQVGTVRVYDFDNGLSRHYPKNYLNVSRERFDAWLRELVPPTVDFRVPAKYVGCDVNSTSGEITVHFRQDDIPGTVKTRMLVGADGAFSPVRRQFVPEFPPRNMYVSVQHWFAPGVESRCYGAFFDREVTDYYSWSIPKGDRLIVGTAVPVEFPARPRFELLLEKLRGLGMKLENEVFREAAMIVRPHSLKDICPVPDVSRCVALVGEAAGWISPSSAEGISYSMRSAEALADALLETPGGLDSWNRVRKIFLRKLKPLYSDIWWKILRIPFMYHPLLRGMIIRSGKFSLKTRGEMFWQEI